MKRKEAEFSRKLMIEFKHTRQRLTTGLKRKLSSKDTKTLIKEEINRLTARQQRVMIKYLAKSFLAGIRDAKKEIKSISPIQGAAPNARAEIGFDLSSINDSNLQKITKANIGVIGNYNDVFSKDLKKQYDELLSDNKLLTSLNREGWSPWLDKTLLKRGIDPTVIFLVKQQKTTAKMLQILNNAGVKGGMHPNSVARRLIPHVQKYFGPGGVTIDRIGQKARRFTIDADGNYAWVQKTIKKKYRATPKTYSRLIAQSAMKGARREAYYRSLEKTNLVSHYISVAVMDARTCGNCSMMHGQIVSHADGPPYHSNCHCDLRPVFARNSVLADKNKPARFYEKQRDTHFLRLNDLKLFNKTLPSGSKLKNYALLLDDALTPAIPPPLHMRKIRHTLMGEPAKIAPQPPQGISHMSDEEWRAEANDIYAKTEKDGVEHMRVYTADGTRRDVKGTVDSVDLLLPGGEFNSLHTHPSWQCPLSNSDMSGFLKIQSEMEAGATTSEKIYIMTKKKGMWTRIMNKEVPAFEKEFTDEVSKILSKVSRYSKRDYHDAYLKAGKIMAKRYGIEYKVIERRL